MRRFFVFAQALLLCIALTPAVQADPAAALTNANIVQFQQAGIASATITTIIKVRKAAYDLTPASLSALRKAGVPDTVVQAMIEAQAREDAPPVAASPEPARQDPSNQAMVPSGLKAWIVTGGTKQPLNASTAQMTQAKSVGGGMQGGGMLQGAATSALSMGAEMALGPLGGLASSALSLFSPKPKYKAPQLHQTWALPGQHAALVLQTALPTFEIDFADIAGIDPSAFEPAIVRLTATTDNWRIVGVTKQSAMGGPMDMGSIMRRMPAGATSMGMGAPGRAEPMEEQLVPASVVLVSPGHARITFAAPLSVGEYGLVLHPKSTDKGSASEPNLGGQGSFNVQVAVWDFTLLPAAAPAASPLPNTTPESAPATGAPAVVPSNSAPSKHDR